MATVIEGRAPGAYIEQVFKQSDPPFLTGVPAFIGLVGASSTAGKSAESDLFSAGPVIQLDKRRHTELESRYGFAWGGGALGLAVRGFFENGGSLCFVVDPRLGKLTAALDALEATEDFDLICAPDIATANAADMLTRQAEIAKYCKDRGSCFAILDSIGAPALVPEITTGALKSHRDALVEALGVVQANESAALYGPWLRVREGCRSCGGTGLLSGSDCATCRGTGGGFLPPCGHVAGIIARTDASAGVHKAPANERIDGAIDIRIRIDDATQAAMNPKGTAWLNVIRAFPGRGLRVWGARTLSSDPEWNQVSVRRLLLTIGRWLERLAQTVAFEPNNFALWIRINRQVNAYLQELFASGAFKGSKPTEAFFVKCDGELNTAQVRESGRVITEVGVAPIKPNEFIIVRLISNAQDSSSSATA
ncbi:MAG TPA: phage tail sheath subtilisin-like domain-containing protein [Polyangiaceae bacterium]|jgi:hypothetical protein|nr:phage tail sheath subtilisin-like domain-containing protein [Polyangiaceae bacterium]